MNRSSRIAHLDVTSGPVLALGLLGLMVLVLFFGSVSQAKAQVSVNIGINAPLPPAYVVPAPPPVVVVPGTYVYFAPGLDVDIFFYQGFWYRPYSDHWYRSRSYNGPWGFVAPARVPRAIVTLPPHYREVHPGRSHIPYGQLKKNWGRWERERYWDNHAEWRDRDQEVPRGHGRRGHDEWDRGNGGFEHGGRGHGQGQGHGR